MASRSRQPEKKGKETDLEDVGAQSRTGARMKRRMASFGRAAECFQGGKWIAQLKSIAANKRGKEDRDRCVLLLLTCVVMHFPPTHFPNHYKSYTYQSPNP